MHRQFLSFLCRPFFFPPRLPRLLSIVSPQKTQPPFSPFRLHLLLGFNPPPPVLSSAQRSVSFPHLAILRRKLRSFIGPFERKEPWTIGILPPLANACFLLGRNLLRLPRPSLFPQAPPSPDKTIVSVRRWYSVSPRYDYFLGFSSFRNLPPSGIKADSSFFSDQAVLLSAPPSA